MGFTWVKYRAINTDNGTALWPERHPIEELQELREWDPVMFSREYQNDPTDDASSLFPWENTERMLDLTATFDSSHRAVQQGEVIVLGYDPAASGRADSDYCSLTIIAVDIHTFRRRFIWAYRARGLDFDEQIDLIVRTCRKYKVGMGYIEQNGFQRWLLAELLKYPEARGIAGHNTGLEKTSPIDGIPALAFAVARGYWDGSLPCGDSESAAYANVLRTEAAAMGVRDGRPHSLGEHDDTVMSLWLADRAARFLEWWFTENAGPEYVTLEDLGIEPVDLGPY